MCYEDCSHKCVFYYQSFSLPLAGSFPPFIPFVPNYGIGPCLGSNAYSVLTSGTQCLFGYSNAKVLRSSAAIAYIYNADSRVLCPDSTVYTFKSNDKCYKSCVMLGLKDCSISLCGKNCVANSDKFDIKTLKNIRTGINEGITVNSTSTFSKEFLDFYANQFISSPYTVIMNSVISTVQGLDENVWGFKIGNSSKSIMPDEAAGRFFNSSYFEIATDMIANLKKWAKTADVTKSDAPKPIDFYGSRYQRLFCGLFEFRIPKS